MWSVLGQDKAVFLLRRSLEIGSLAHAYLFVGPPHVGKMTLAINLAQALNCRAVDPPCGECISCQKIATARHADVPVVDLSQDGDGNGTEYRARIGVGQIEQLQHSASLPPFEGDCRVFIINGADLLSIGAANRLLKTLEEPVGKVVFILLTVNEQLLPATIVSRCQRLELFPMPVGELEKALQGGWGVEPAKARLLAKLAHGCPGWAISAIRDERLLKQREEYLDELLDLASADNEERFAYVARLISGFQQNRGLVQERLSLWLDWWRDLLLVRAGSSNDVASVDRLDTLIDMAGDYSLTQIRGYIDNIRAASLQLRQNANIQLLLEVLMLDMPEARRRGAGRMAARLR